MTEQPDERSTWERVGWRVAFIALIASGPFVVFDNDHPIRVVLWLVTAAGFIVSEVGGWRRRRSAAARSRS